MDNEYSFKKSFNRQRIYSTIVAFSHLILGLLMGVFGIIYIIKETNTHPEFIKPMHYILIFVFLLLAFNMFKIISVLLKKTVALENYKRIPLVLRPQAFILLLLTGYFGYSIFSAEKPTPTILGDAHKIVGMLLLLITLFEFFYIISSLIFQRRMAKHKRSYAV